MRFIPPRILSLFTVLLLGCTWTLSLRAVEKNASYQAALESIQSEDISEEIGALTDDAMEGREAGTRGGLAAAEYLAKRYAGFGLPGGAPDGDFFQPFTPNFRNVLAFLQGSDPALRDEVIVVGAHYDHIGFGRHGMSLGPYGYIHPGADDNGSGTAAVLELAQAFAMLPTPPKRSILFASWDAEEKGLFGSKHWVAHPTVALDHIKAAINLDMIGHLRDDHVVVFGSRSGYGWRRLLSMQNETGLQLDFSWSLKPNADHYAFFDSKIPVLMLHTGLHDQYHRPSDNLKLINKEGMTRITRMLFGMLEEMADGEVSPPRFRDAAKYETPETEKTVSCHDAKPVDRLGISWIEDAAATDGVVISRIKGDSPADRAGLRPGDCIVRFADRDIRADDDFFGAVATADSPALAVVRRAGEEKPVDVKIELSGKPLRWGIGWRVDDAEPGVVILTRVVPGTPAALAGLSESDRIYQVAGQDFADEAAFLQLLNGSSVPLQLLVERDGRLRVVLLRSTQITPMDRAA